MRKKFRKQEKIKKRKNFFPTLLLTLFFGAGWGWVVFKTAPTNNWSLFAFFSLFFVAIFLASALILANSRRGALVAAGLTLFLLFRYYQLANALNLILLLGILVSIEAYFSKKS